VIQVNPEKIEPNPGGKEDIVEQQENPNNDAAIHSLRACRKERAACQEATEANPEKMEKTENLKSYMEKTDRVIAILEQMIAMTKANREKMEAMDLKANPEKMESELEHRKVRKKDATVKRVKERNKQERDWHLAVGRHREPKELTRGDCGSQMKLAASCMRVSHRATVAWCKRNVFRKI
jgi:predicted kinase